MTETPEITAAILADHEQLRLGFVALDEASGAEELSVCWEDLATRLDAHAEAEERIFYPQLLQVGTRAKDETDDAIGDHNKIRDAVRDADAAAVGSSAWWEAVGRARTENSTHLAEEEREALPDFRRHAPDQLRHELGQIWARFYVEHPAGRGVTTRDKDPEDYIARHDS